MGSDGCSCAALNSSTTHLIVATIFHSKIYVPHDDHPGSSVPAVLSERPRPLKRHVPPQCLPSELRQHGMTIITILQWHIAWAMVGPAPCTTGSGLIAESGSETEQTEI